MMTMASSTADNTPPRPHNNIICTATPSKPLRESIALKDGTRGIDSTRYKHQTALREIPTRISPSTPNAAVVNHHNDDANCPPHKTRPDLSPTRTKSNSLPQVSSPKNDDYVNHTLKKINQMISSWPPLPASTAAVIDCHDNNAD